jgi:ubiquinone/menaquinone biosynthesis C-methylase UbiE
VAYRRYPDERERRKWQDPEAILNSIGLQAGLTFMDIGCGTGFFALPAARIIGESGKVYGIDKDAESINNLKKMADSEGLHNLDLTVGKAEEVVKCTACADIIFFGIVLHDFENPAVVLENARKMLKPGGRLVNLDWKKEPTELGPPLKIRFSQEEAVRLIEAAGFRIQKVAESGPYHYLVMAGQ